MKKFFLLLEVALLLFVWGCSSIDCPINNKVYSSYAFYITGNDDLGEAVSLNGELTVSTKRWNGTDTVLINRQKDASVIQLPLSYLALTDTLTFVLVQDSVRRVSDVVYVEKTNDMHFESIDCGATYFHTLKKIGSTHNFIDSVVIINPGVTYDVTENARIYVRK
ncbi:MAG: hypothetical protein HUK08_04515 [Bacteroidaceae bacterium]|nr:hypothetical protein [Bacteroidaceae bacterium]